MSEGLPPSQALRSRGLAPRKRLGQNFLQDRNVLARIAGAAELSNTDTVLEIGPGTGELTAALAASAGRVVAVELDDRLVELLHARFEGNRAVEIVHGNALAADPCSLPGMPYKVVANIPYYITGHLIRHFLEAACRPSLMVLLVQLEVARRMVAQPGDLSLLGVSVQFFSVPEIVFRIPAGAFYPRPKVDSAVVRLQPHSQLPSPAIQAAVFRLARAGFAEKRKQIANSLTHNLPTGRTRVEEVLELAGVAPTRRAETLSLREWERLAEAWETRAAGATQ